MPLEHVMSSEVFPPRPPSPAPRTDAGYERELAAARVTESQLREALARSHDLLGQKDEEIRHQEVLKQECQHRLLNNLQVIASLLSMQSRKEPDAKVAARISVAAKRVGAIAHLHRHLHSMDSTETVEFKQYLDELCRDHSTMSRSEERCQDIAVEAVGLKLPTVTAIPLGLIVNELVTNALKHGEGRITVKLEPHVRQGYALSVCNAGTTLPEGFDPATCSGLGMNLVSAFTKEIDGELQIDRSDDNGCTRFTVFFGSPDAAPAAVTRSIKGVHLEGRE